jgi:hypothetical protein
MIIKKDSTISAGKSHNFLIILVLYPQGQPLTRVLAGLNLITPTGVDSDK